MPTTITDADIRWVIAAHLAAERRRREKVSRQSSYEDAVALAELLRDSGAIITGIARHPDGEVSVYYTVQP